MSEVTIYRIALTVFALAVFCAGVWTVRLRPEMVEKVEKYPRNRLWGMILGWWALIWCVPHAAAVSPGFLLPWLWPLALAVPVACYFFLDYLLARAVGGLMILSAYFLVHATFEHHAPGAAIAAVTGWMWGLAGIWISGKPAALRDWIRRCCANGGFRKISAGLMMLFGAVIFIVMTLTR